EDRWSTKYVEYLYRQGIISGSAKGDSLVYKPEDNMTRQEFAKLIVAWTGRNIDDYAETELLFNDNDRIDAWALPYVKAAYSLGIMNGKSSGEIMNFDPQGRLTRQEAMTVIGRLTEKGFEKSDLLDFPDRDKVADWAYDYVATLVKIGIISGSDGKLMPEGNITREQAAKIIFEIN
ncbi:MAG: S-layer homology domain-containing protein, partial [Firmicutes bacterium]|nr:S-layer homology domain-containing protein [Bacillota bacterium]